MVCQFTCWLLCFLSFFGKVSYAIEELQDCQTDVIIFIDSSDSILPFEFELQKEFAKNLTRRLRIDSVNGAVVTALSFSTSVFGIGLQPWDRTKEKLIDEIQNLPNEKEGTWTHYAIRLGAEVFRTEGRTEFDDVMIMFTDGRSKFPANTLDEADSAKFANILLVAIGIGTLINQTELKQMSSPGIPLLILNPDNAEELLNIVAVLACKGLVRQDVGDIQNQLLQNYIRTSEL